ncbi:MAG: RNA ligase family protein [Acidithiobacillus sp.]
MQIEFFHSIEQFKNIVKLVRDRSNFSNTQLPTLKFTGTVKLHGTNAGLTNIGGNATAISRTRVLNANDDNFGFFAQQIGQYEKDWQEYLDNIGENVTVFGEWCGKGIQKGVGISNLERMFIIFSCKIGDLWIPVPHSPKIPNVFVITEFQTYEITIDFSCPEQATNILGEITQSVENECPVALKLGSTGVGEGVVWTCDSDPSLVFKVKGEKHSSTKVKTLAAVDVERISSLKDLVGYVLSNNRMEQIYNEMILESESFQNKNIGVFIQKCVHDCIKEESDTIAASGFSIKDFTKIAPHIAKNWIFGRI